MNNHDKALLGLSCHARSKCSECPYEDMPECSSKLAADAEKMLRCVKEDVEMGICCATCVYDTVDADELPCATCADAYAHGNWQWRGAEVE